VASGNNVEIATEIKPYTPKDSTEYKLVIIGKNRMSSPLPAAAPPKTVAACLKNSLDSDIFLHLVFLSP
jgi:hypothetical protein